MPPAVQRVVRKVTEGAKLALLHFLAELQPERERLHGIVHSEAVALGRGRIEPHLKVEGGEAPDVPLTGEYKIDDAEVDFKG